MKGLFLKLLASALFVGYPASDPRCENPDGIYYVPDTDNCGKFFECNRGNIFEMFCPPGMYFSPKLLYCDFIEKVECIEANSTLCPSPTETKNIAYPYDCSKFYRCSQGIPKLSECPENLYFNPSTESCDYIDNVDCSHISSTPVVPSSSDKTTSTLAPTTNSPTTASTICASVTGTTNIVYPYDCGKYYHCQDGISELLACPENMYFNPLTKLCDFLDNVDCSAISSTSNAPTTVEPITTNTPVKPTTDSPTTVDTVCMSITGTKNILYPYDCSKFYRCANGKSSLLDCPENLYFNPSTESCDFMDMVDCSSISTSSTVPGPTTMVSTTSTSSTVPASTSETSTTTIIPTPFDPSSICANEPNATYLADPTDCHKFFECSDGIAVSLTCAIGTIWNEIIHACITSDKDC